MGIGNWLPSVGVSGRSATLSIYIYIKRLAVDVLVTMCDQWSQREYGPRLLLPGLFVRASHTGTGTCTVHVYCRYCWYTVHPFFFSPRTYRTRRRRRWRHQLPAGGRVAAVIRGRKTTLHWPLTCGTGVRVGVGHWHFMRSVHGQRLSRHYCLPIYRNHTPVVLSVSTGFRSVLNPCPCPFAVIPACGNYFSANITKHK